MKLKAWGVRYLPGEIFGTATALITAYIFYAIYKQDRLVVAYAGAIGEAIGFYGVVILQNFFRTNKQCYLEKRKIGLSDFRKIMVSIAFEFGPAAIIDDLTIRPFFMYLFPIILNNFFWGILIGKLIGDIAFYLLVIISYEFKQWYLKKKLSR